VAPGLAVVQDRAVSTIRQSVVGAAAGLVLTCLAALPLVTAPRSVSDSIPERLSDQEFWRLTADLSEPDGYFRTDNLVSNELLFQTVIPDLARTVTPGGVYLGVGPEQNFTYIAALRPAMAFIIDIRRGNLHEHLMYKALFELSADRADFVSRLFSMKRPPGLTRKSTAHELFAAYRNPQIAASEDLHAKTLEDIRQRLATTHHLPLSASDLSGIETVFREFFIQGLDIQYSIFRERRGGSFPTYPELMTATDGSGVPRGFLANEENFAVVKDLESRNLILPVVGNFGGPRALRAIGEYVRDHGAIISVFYVSNVEQYLSPFEEKPQFCANVTALPIDESSTFIRSTRSGAFGLRGFMPGFSGGPSRGFMSRLDNMLTDLRICAAVASH
jgi:hypothetical protein